MINEKAYFKEKKNLAVYPYNKYSKCIVNHTNLLPFTIKLVDTNSSSNENGTIHSIDEFIEHGFDDIDSFLFLNPDENDNDTYSLKQLFHEYILKKNISTYFISLKNALKYTQLFPEYKAEILMPRYTSTFGKRLIPLYEKYEKDNGSTIPIISIFGSTYNQNKFSFILQLYTKLKQRGYSLNVLSKNFIGNIWGFNTLISNLLPVNRWMFCLKSFLKREEYNDNDLVLIGESGTFYHDIYNIEILNEIQPDFNILCINTNDSIDKISLLLSRFKCLNIQGVLPHALYMSNHKTGDSSIATLDEESIDTKYKKLSDCFNIKVFYDKNFFQLVEYVECTLHLSLTKED